MGDPQVTMGLNTKSCSNLGDLGYPHDLGNLHLGGEDERMIGIIRNHAGWRGFADCRCSRQQGRNISWCFYEHRVKIAPVDAICCNNMLQSSKDK